MAPTDEPPREQNGNGNGNGALPDAVAARVFPARIGARLTTKERAVHMGTSVWQAEQLGASGAAGGSNGASTTDGLPATAQTPQQSTEHAAAVAAEAEAALNSGKGSTLVLGAIALLVIIRFFSEVVRVLPGFTNFVDIPVFATILFVAALRAPPNTDIRRLPAGLGLACFLFVAVCAISTLSNLSRIDLAPALVFMYGLLSPLAIFYAVYRLWPVNSSLRLSRLLVMLALLQLAVAFLYDLPRWFADPGRNPDLFSGTFGENPYQLVFFLLVSVGLLAGIFTFEKRRPITRLIPVLLFAIFIVTFLAQYRALLLTMFLAIVLLAVLLAPQSTRGVIGASLALLALVGTMTYAAQNIPEFKFQATIEDSNGDPTFYLKQRIKTFDPIETMFAEHPSYTVTGTGPGTFSSRAWRTFAVVVDSETDVASGYAQKLTGGRPYQTDVSDRYLVPALRDADLISGSHAVTSPYSEYSALLAEVGVPGFLLITGLYVWAFLASLRITRRSLKTAKQGDPLPGLACASLVAFFALLQMGILGNWLEVTRITFITWIIFAVVMKEYNARKPDEAVLPVPIATTA